MISEKRVSQKTAFFSLRSGSQNGCQNSRHFSATFLLTRVSRSASRFASFWVGRFRSVLIRKENPTYDFLVTSLRESISDRHFARPTFSITRVCVSYHPLHSCDPLFCSLRSPSDCSNRRSLRRTCSLERRIFSSTSSLGRAEHCFQRMLLSCTIRGGSSPDPAQTNTASVVVCFCFVIFFRRHLFCRGRKFLIFSVCAPPSTTMVTKKKREH